MILTIQHFHLAHPVMAITVLAVLVRVVWMMDVVELGAEVVAGVMKLRVIIVARSSITTAVMGNAEVVVGVVGVVGVVDDIILLH